MYDRSQLCAAVNEAKAIECERLFRCPPHCHNSSNPISNKCFLCYYELFSVTPKTVAVGQRMLFIELTDFTILFTYFQMKNHCLTSCE